MNVFPVSPPHLLVLLLLRVMLLGATAVVTRTPFLLGPFHTVTNLTFTYSRYSVFTIANAAAIANDASSGDSRSYKNSLPSGSLSHGK
jgi:hypothetical protein